MKTNLSVQKSFSLIFLFMTAIILVLTYLLVKSNQELKLEKCSYKCEKQTHVINGNRNIGFGNNSIRIKVVRSSTCNSPKNAGIGYIAESRGATKYDTLVINHVKALQELNKNPRHAGVQACTAYSKAEIDSAIRICAKLGALPTTTALGINDSPLKK